MGFSVTSVQRAQLAVKATRRDRGAAERRGLSYGCKTERAALPGKVSGRPTRARALLFGFSAATRPWVRLFCSSRPTSDIVIEARELTGFGDIPIRKMPARIARIEWPAPDVAVISLQLPANERLQFRAGQYLDFILKDGARRQYSIATAPHADELIQLHIRRTPGGVFTDRLFGVVEPPVKERDILRIEAPLGTFFLREDNARPIVLLAGGTGFAPVKAIAEHVFYKRINRDEADQPARDVYLYWGARARPDLYMADLPERWSREQPNFVRPRTVRAPAAGRLAGPLWLCSQAVMDDLPDLSAFQVTRAVLLR